MSVIWLRVAAAFYSLGLLDAVVTVIRKRERLFRPALAAFAAGGLFHLVAIVEEGLTARHFPANGFFESMSFCAFIVTVLFLFVYWRYRAESLSVFIFPLVFVMTLVAALGSPVSAWSNPVVRNSWLVVHVVCIMLGYAALLFTSVAAVVYLFQEHELKRKKPHNFYYRLPPLATLDDLISKSLGVGFVFITVGIIVGSVWAFVELGTRWIADPRIGISFFTWGIYLAMVFFRVSAGWRGRKAAILAIMALCCSAITWATHARLRYLLQ